jgi:hypothetical protein
MDCMANPCWPRDGLARILDSLRTLARFLPAWWQEPPRGDAGWRKPQRRLCGAGC